MQDLVNDISDFSNWSHVEKIKFFAWYLHSRLRQERFNATDIGNCYDQIHLQRPSNIHPFLSSLEKKKPKELLRDSRGYFLEKRVRDSFENKFGQRSATIQVHNLLKDLPNKIPNVAERDFLNEAIICLRNNAPRAAIVMSWNLAFDHLCHFILNQHLVAFNTQYPIRFPKKYAGAQLKAITKRDDFADFQESEILEICKSANIISANTFKILKEKLDRRNIAAHPNTVVFTPLQAEEFISDIVNNAVLQLV